MSIAFHEQRQEQAYHTHRARFPQVRAGLAQLQTSAVALLQPSADPGSGHEVRGTWAADSPPSFSLGPHMFLEPIVKGKMVLGWAQPFPLWETLSRSINERQGGEERSSQGQGQNVWAAREMIKLSS